MRKVLRVLLVAIVVPFTPAIAVALYAEAYISGFLLRFPWIYHIVLRRHNTRLDRQRRAAAGRTRHAPETDVGRL